MKISFVVPCYNEAENVKPFYDSIVKTFHDSSCDYEIVFVDDGSKDATLYNLRKIHNGTTGVKVISLSRNFGKEAALYAGLCHTTGDFICFIDADLQQPPATAMEMLQLLIDDPQIDIVAAYQDHRKEGKVLSFFKRSFYRLINRLSDVNLQSDASDFRVFRRQVAEDIIRLREYHRFSKGIFAWVGYNTQYLPYTAQARNAGKSKWNFFALLNYAAEGIIGYSTKPLRIATFMGLGTAIISMIYLIVVILQKLIAGIDVPGYATIIVLILFLGGMQLLCIGIIGEYVGKTFEQSKDRPIYIAKEILE